MSKRKNTKKSKPDPFLSKPKIPFMRLSKLTDHQVQELSKKVPTLKVRAHVGW